MATSDVDQLVLGQLAKSLPPSRLATALFQLLGLSVMLSKAVFQARKQRRLDTSRDTKSLRLYQRIIWLANQGLTILRRDVLPFTDPDLSLHLQDRQDATIASGPGPGLVASHRLPTADTAAALFAAPAPSPGTGIDLNVAVAIAKPELPVLAAKLHASFFHTFCLFHNNPPVQSVWPFTSTAADMHQIAGAGNSEDLAALELAAALSSHHGSTPDASPPSGTVREGRSGLGSASGRTGAVSGQKYAANPSMAPSSPYQAHVQAQTQVKDGGVPPQWIPLSPPLSPANSPKGVTHPVFNPADRASGMETGGVATGQWADPSLRGPIPSVASESSYVTNPFANVPPGRPFSEANLEPEEAQFLASLNQNLAAAAAAAANQAGSTPPERFHTPANVLAAPSTPPSFILPSRNFISEAASLFKHTSKLAASKLAPSHPLRLSVALEHAAFLWDIVHNFDEAKRIARHAIQLVSTDDQPLTDSDFETAAVMVTLLGKFRRREIPASMIMTPAVAGAPEDSGRTDRPTRDRNDRPAQQYNQKALDDLTGTSNRPFHPPSRPHGQHTRQELQQQSKPQTQTSRGNKKTRGGNVAARPVDSPIGTESRSPPLPSQPPSQIPGHPGKHLHRPHQPLQQQHPQLQVRHRNSPENALREQYSFGESLEGVSAGQTRQMGQQTVQQPQHQQRQREIQDKQQKHDAEKQNYNTASGQDQSQRRFDVSSASSSPTIPLRSPFFYPPFPHHQQHEQQSPRSEKHARQQETPHQHRQHGLSFSHDIPPPRNADLLDWTTEAGAQRQAHFQHQPRHRQTQLSHPQYHQPAAPVAHTPMEPETGAEVMKRVGRSGTAYPPQQPPLQRQDERQNQEQQQGFNTRSRSPLIVSSSTVTAPDRPKSRNAGPKISSQSPSRPHPQDQSVYHDYSAGASAIAPPVSAVAPHTYAHNVSLGVPTSPQSERHQQHPLQQRQQPTKQQQQQQQQQRVQQQHQYASDTSYGQDRTNVPSAISDDVRHNPVGPPPDPTPSVHSHGQPARSAVTGGGGGGGSGCSGSASVSCTSGCCASRSPPSVPVPAQARSASRASPARSSRGPGSGVTLPLGLTPAPTFAITSAAAAAAASRTQGYSHSYSNGKASSASASASGLGLGLGVGAGSGLGAHLNQNQVSKPQRYGYENSHPYVQNHVQTSSGSAHGYTPGRSQGQGGPRFGQAQYSGHQQPFVVRSA